MKKIYFISLLGFLGLITLFSTSKVQAVSPQKIAQETRKEIRQEIRQEIKEATGSKVGVIKNIISKLARASIVGGTLSAKNGTTLTVTKDGKTYTINTSSSTQLRRRFWGKATLDEMQVGDTLNIHGKWSDEAQTTITANLVRDLSIQKRFGVFFGTIESVSGSTWVMQTAVRGKQTVTVTSSTKFVDRANKTINQTDIVVDHKVRVKGLWDKANNTVTEVSHVKDYSLPIKPTPTVK